MHLKPENSEFRTDINMLRAIAVVSVLLFHFKISLVPSGFAGVDVFFVISGFLMTKIIVGGIENGSFRFVEFYLSRMRRIVPALLLLCAVLLLLSWFILLPSEYRLLSKHVVSSILFASNMIYSRESGYFDSAADEKLLLHTWSLSIEWQFYLIYPIVLYCLARFFNRRQIVIALIVFVVFSVLYISAISGLSARYFSFPERAWEMVAGGLAFLIPLPWCPRRRKTAFLIGLLMILTAMLLFDKSIPWPSIPTLLPITGTMLVLMANNKHSCLQNNKLIGYVGKSSYSIYLWHWPVAVYFFSFTTAHSAVSTFYAIALSFILGFISYEFVEKTFSKSINKKTSNRLIPGIMFVVVGGALLIFINNGFGIPSRFPDKVIAADNERTDQDPRKSHCAPEDSLVSPHCLYPEGEKQVGQVLFGDSHASALIKSFGELNKENGATLLISQPGCPSLRGVIKQGRSDRNCADFISNELDFLDKNHPNTPVFVYNRWAYYISGKLENHGKPLISFDSSSQKNIADAFYHALETTWCPVAKQRPVTMLLPTPEFVFDVPRQQARELLAGVNNDVSMSESDYLQRNDLVISNLKRLSQSCNIKLIDLSAHLCVDGRCYGAKAGRPLYYDDNHLSIWGAKYVLDGLVP